MAFLICFSLRRRRHPRCPGPNGAPGPTGPEGELDCAAAACDPVEAVPEVVLLWLTCGPAALSVPVEVALVTGEVTWTRAAPLVSPAVGGAELVLGVVVFTSITRERCGAAA